MGTLKLDLSLAKQNSHQSKIPQSLELCAAFHPVEIAEFSMDLHMNSISLFSDSKVVLVQWIRRSCVPQPWKYVPSELNPADHSLRPVSADSLKDNTWLMEPDFICTVCAYQLIWTHWPCQIQRFSLQSQRNNSWRGWHICKKKEKRKAMTAENLEKASNSCSWIRNICQRIKLKIKLTKLKIFFLI